MSSGTTGSDNAFRFLSLYISWIFFILRWFFSWEVSTLGSDMIPRIYRFANSLFQWKSIALLPLESISVQLRDSHLPFLDKVPNWTNYWIRRFIFPVNFRCFWRVFTLFTASHNKTLVGGRGSILYPHFLSFPQSPCKGREWLSVSASGELLDLGWTGEF